MNKKYLKTYFFRYFKYLYIKMMEIIFITIGIGITIGLNAKLKLLLYYTKPENNNEKYGDL